MENKKLHMRDSTRKKILILSGMLIAFIILEVLLIL